MGMERRESQRKELEVIVHFYFHGHEKVFASKTRNISLSGLCIQAGTEVLSKMNLGGTVTVFLEYVPNYLLKLKGYVVRCGSAPGEMDGFAVKFLEVDETQRETISKLL